MRGICIDRILKILSLQQPKIFLLKTEEPCVRSWQAGFCGVGATMGRPLYPMTYTARYIVLDKLIK